MKGERGIVSSILMMQEAGRKLLRLKPKVKYRLPEMEREPFFSRWLHRKVRQEMPQELRRHRNDIIHFI